MLRVFWNSHLGLRQLYAAAVAVMKCMCSCAAELPLLLLQQRCTPEQSEPQRCAVSPMDEPQRCEVWTPQPTGTVHASEHSWLIIV
jgi:hypothetical protein